MPMCPRRSCICDFATVLSMMISGDHLNMQCGSRMRWRTECATIPYWATLTRVAPSPRPAPASRRACHAAHKACLGITCSDT
eukprot:4326040-Pleurochrysis_carterae.AAC.4